MKNFKIIMGSMMIAIMLLSTGAYSKIKTDLQIFNVSLDGAGLGGTYPGYNITRSISFSFAHNNQIDSIAPHSAFIQLTLPSTLHFKQTAPASIPSGWDYIYGDETNLMLINNEVIPPYASMVNGDIFLEIEFSVLFDIVGPVPPGSIIGIEVGFTDPSMGAGVFNYQFANPSFNEPIIVNVQVIDNPLAITLGHFAAKAKGCETELVWTTLSETNNSYFAVERSRDGKNFEVIGKVESKVNNSTEAVSYHYTDNAPLKGQNFYRLTQYDFDGKSTSSAIEKVNISCQALDVSLFPNPTKGVVYIKGIQDASTIKVFNVLGQEVLSQASDKLGTSIIDISTLAVGSYTVKILQNEEVVFTSKIVKQD